jgi:hypothetical protein
MDGSTIEEMKEGGTFVKVVHASTRTALSSVLRGVLRA